MKTTFLSGGRPIRLDAYQPEELGDGPAAAILLLHGAGGNTGFWLDRLVPYLAQANTVIYSLHYFDRTGTERADAQILWDGIHVPLWLDTIRDAIAHIGTQPGIDRRRIALVGVSLGAFLSLALGTERDSGIRALVDVSGGLVPPYQGSAERDFPPTLILHGDADQVVPVSFARQLEQTLQRLGVTHRTQIYAGEGHWFSSGAQQSILAEVAAFLQEQLQLAGSAQSGASQPQVTQVQVL